MYTLHRHKHQQLVNKCLCVFVNLIYKFRIILFIIEQTKSMSLNFYLGLNVMVDSRSISFTAISLLTNLLLHRILLQLCISRLSSASTNYRLTTKLRPITECCPCKDMVLSVYLKLTSPSSSHIILFLLLW